MKLLAFAKGFIVILFRKIWCRSHCEVRSPVSGSRSNGKKWSRGQSLPMLDNSKNPNHPKSWKKSFSKILKSIMPTIWWEMRLFQSHKISTLNQTSTLGSNLLPASVCSRYIATSVARDQYVSCYYQPYRTKGPKSPWPWYSSTPTSKGFHRNFKIYKVSKVSLSAVISGPIFYIASAGHALFWTLGASSFITLIHAVFRYQVKLRWKFEKLNSEPFTHLPGFLNSNRKDNGSRKDVRIYSEF